ncbi:hypothetical protein NEIMUCOT_03840 [Neisseria mucosa ATCC 25996]|uniref:Uncharacterized protein n=1 Tax=Neisseria mucosa (strain ATCC 25996 / DSM 4631 / NCTC 10774 / M26) TaxID=546266 RepID=D2ZTA4_NEIM2|nr:hypothetical protein NEIMUCOT_03840 [Neisseria mucosa ATCC 25996]
MFGLNNKRSSEIFQTTFNFFICVRADCVNFWKNKSKVIFR